MTTTHTEPVFNEIDVPGTPVRVFEPVKLELADGSRLEVVRVDNRISAQIADYLVSVDVPGRMAGEPLVALMRRAFSTAGSVVHALGGSAVDAVDAAADSVSVIVMSEGRRLVINCSSNC